MGQTGLHSEHTGFHGLNNDEGKPDCCTRNVRDCNITKVDSKEFEIKTKHKDKSGRKITG